MIMTLDCEFNSFGGELISMALVAQDGEEFYEVLKYAHMDIDPWVAEHVIPILNKEPVSLFAFQHKLEKFLCQYETPVVVADWHQDISYLCDAIITGPGMRLRTPDMTMVVKDIEAPSKLPHNALEDARGIMEHIITEDIHDGS